jgi:6-phosphogluconolactonase/glucosamine-6-phosphate isomerase/deaminase
VHLEVYSNQRWAHLVTQKWLSYIHERPNSRICLPTGETPRPLYSRSAPSIDLSSSTVFLLDEFDLPRGSAARCDAMLQHDLLAKLPRPPGVLHRLHVEAPDPGAECERFDAIVGEGGLDLTLLGLGSNGHLGLNEPGTAADSPTRVVELALATTNSAARYDAEAEPVRGMTLGMRRILESKEIWLLVTGEHKASILGRMLSGPISAEIPASYLRDHPNATVIADESAAAGL